MLRYVLALAVVAVVVWVLASHTDELSGIPGALEHLHWWWIPFALLAEVASLASFAGLQFELLKTGGLEAPKVTLFQMTVASQAITNSLPGGTAVSAVYGFRWYRRFGADDTLAVWAMVGTVVAAMVSLSIVACAGLALATGEGASLDLIPVLIGVLVVTVSIGAVFVYERPLAYLLSGSVRLSRALIKRPRGDATATVDRITAWVTSVKLSWRQIITIVLWGTANWLFDCACFAMMFLAIGSTIPWNGILLAYGAGQLAAALPITPGGLGAVEGSITIALVAFGGAHVTTVDAVLLYRLISFWLVLVVGWMLWGVLALEVRRGRWRRQAMTAPVAAGPDTESIGPPSLVAGVPAAPEAWATPGTEGGS
jgi:putative heme transporter